MKLYVVFTYVLQVGWVDKDEVSVSELSVDLSVFVGIKMGGRVGNGEVLVFEVIGLFCAD